MKVKVCGLNNQENITQLQKVGLDFMGFIFYDKSKRGVTYGDIDSSFVLGIEGVNKVGVFVDAPIEEVISIADEFQLDYVQLHGKESPEYCNEARNRGLKTIKAIPVSGILPVNHLKSYQKVLNLFLFDTSGKEKGGNGTKFEWQILEDYHLDIPYLLAGGITENDAVTIKNMNLKMLYGVDLNSRFELEAGLKDVNKVKRFINELSD